MDIPKVTVIIPCYNRDSFVRKTVDSALAQTYSNIEVVVVDDGSTDGTRKILESYSNRISIYEHNGRANKGQSAAINLAMRATESDYVAILDSDDLWEPNKIAKQTEVFENNQEVGLVYSNGYAIDENDDKLYRLLPDNHIELNKPELVLLNCYFNLPSNSLVRRSAYEKSGLFDESLRSAQDHDMAIRLAEVTKFAFIKEVLWSYRKHSNTQSQQNTERRWQLGFQILHNACKRYPYGLSVKRKRMAVLYFRLGQCAIDNRKFMRALKYFSFAGLLDPLRSMKVLLKFEGSAGLR